MIVLIINKIKLCVSNISILLHQLTRNFSHLIKLIKSIIKFTAATNARMKSGKYLMSTYFVECEIRSFLNRSACHKTMHLASAIYNKSNTMLPNSNHSFFVASLVFLSSLFNSFLLFLFFTTMATIAIPTPHIAAMIGLMYL